MKLLDLLLFIALVGTLGAGVAFVLSLHADSKCFSDAGEHVGCR
jgi:hypothetical protein